MTNTPYILIVDDDKQVVRYLKDALAESGYAVTATTSGRNALDSIRDRMPDLLIVDLNMPEPDGFDFLKMRRAKYPYMRILVISGYLGGALLEAARIFGAIATLEKPVAAETLVAKVRELLGREKHDRC
jgi:DNA-binding response OmpR family regulator